MTRALNLLEEARTLCGDVDGQRRVNPSMEPNSKRRASENADISRSLLFAAHLADNVRIEILNQYHLFKGEAAVPAVHLPDTP